MQLCSLEITYSFKKIWAPTKWQKVEVDKTDAVPAFLQLSKRGNIYIDYLLHEVCYNVSQCLLSDYYVPNTVQSDFYILVHLILTINLWGRYYYFCYTKVKR